MHTTAKSNRHPGVLPSTPAFLREKQLASDEAQWREAWEQSSVHRRSSDTTPQLRMPCIPPVPTCGNVRGSARSPFHETAYHETAFHILSCTVGPVKSPLCWAFEAERMHKALSALLAFTLPGFYVQETEHGDDFETLNMGPRAMALPERELAIYTGSNFALLLPSELMEIVLLNVQAWQDNREELLTALRRCEGNVPDKCSCVLRGDEEEQDERSCGRS